MPHIIVGPKEKGTFVVQAQTDKYGRLSGWAALRSLNERTIADTDPRTLALWIEVLNQTDIKSIIVVQLLSGPIPDLPEHALPLYGVVRPMPGSVAVLNNEQVKPGNVERGGITFEIKP